MNTQPLINGKTYDYVSITMTILGVPILGVKSINYTEEQEKNKRLKAPLENIVSQIKETNTMKIFNSERKSDTEWLFCTSNESEFEKQVENLFKWREWLLRIYTIEHIEFDVSFWEIL